MSQSTCITFFGGALDALSDFTASSLCRWLGTETLRFAVRTSEVDAAFKTYIESGDIQCLDFENVAVDSGLFEMLLHYRPPGTLMIDVGRCSALEKVQAIVNMATFDAIRGDWVPTECFVSIGFHDVFDLDPPKFVARPAVSVRFNGYGTPAFFQECQKAICESEALSLLCCEFGSALGAIARIHFAIMP